MKTPTVDSHFDALEERIRALYAERDGAIQAGGRIASQLAKAWDHIRALEAALTAENCRLDWLMRQTDGVAEVNAMTDGRHVSWSREAIDDMLASLTPETPAKVVEPPVNMDVLCPECGFLIECEPNRHSAPMEDAEC